MEQHKLENEFRQQLNSREIKPSEMAWDKLDAMLTVAEEKKPKRSFNWIYVAASFVGFLLVGLFYFIQKENPIENQKNGVVIQNPVAPKTSVPSEDFRIEEKGSEDNIVQQSTSKSDKPSGLNQESIVVEKTELPIINQEKEQFASSNINEESIDEMLAVVKTTSKADNSKTAIKVNPNALLSQVDGELELSFREKVINKVNKNYQTVKVALANRNQE